MWRDRIWRRYRKSALLVSVFLNCISIPALALLPLTMFWVVQTASYYEKDPMTVMTIRNICPQEAITLEPGPGSLVPFAKREQENTRLFFTRVYTVHDNGVSEVRHSFYGVSIDGKLRVIERHEIPQSVQEGKIEIYLGFRDSIWFLKDSKETTLFRKYVVHIRGDCDFSGF